MQGVSKIHFLDCSSRFILAMFIKDTSQLEKGLILLVSIKIQVCYANDCIVVS